MLRSRAEFRSFYAQTDWLAAIRLRFAGIKGKLLAAVSMAATATASMSRRMMRPSGPVPWMVRGSMRRSSARARATGEMRMRALLGWLVVGGWRLEAAGAAGRGGKAGGCGAGDRSEDLSVRGSGVGVDGAVGRVSGGGRTGCAPTLVAVAVRGGVAAGVDGADVGAGWGGDDADAAGAGAAPLVYFEMSSVASATDAVITPVHSCPRWLTQMSPRRRNEVTSVGGNQNVVAREFRKV